jgi:hypothetical protein
MKRQNAKDLLIDDHDYSSPGDHYFSYVGANKGAENRPEKE